MQSYAKYFIVIGAILLAIGVILYFFGNKFNWFGNLPGDVKVEKENFRFYAPLMSMLLISIVVSLIIWLINKFKH